MKLRRRILFELPIFKGWPSEEPQLQGTQDSTPENVAPIDLHRRRAAGAGSKIRRRRSNILETAGKPIDKC